MHPARAVANITGLFVIILGLATSTEAAICALVFAALMIGMAG